MSEGGCDREVCDELPSGGEPYVKSAKTTQY